jgi:predicted amidohydrolase YtcJ
MLERSVPQIVLYNGQMRTMNPHQPRAQAGTIADGRFFAQGTT